MCGGMEGCGGHRRMQRPSSSGVTLETAPESHIPVTTKGPSHGGGEEKPHSLSWGDSRGVGKHVPPIPLDGRCWAGGEGAVKGAASSLQGEEALPSPRSGRKAPARAAGGSPRQPDPSWQDRRSPQRWSFK